MNDLKQIYNGIQSTIKNAPIGAPVSNVDLYDEFYQFPYSDPSYIIAGYPSKKGSDVNDEYVQEK